MFALLETAIANLNDDAPKIEEILTALRIEYTRSEKVYSYSIQVWYHLNSSCVTHEEQIALGLLLQRLSLSTSLETNPNTNFITLKVEFD